MQIQNRTSDSTEHHRKKLAPSILRKSLSCGLIAGTLVTLVSAESLADVYRGKHGNPVEFQMSAPIPDPTASNLEYIVPYTSIETINNVDVERSGEFVISTATLPGSTPGLDDYALRIYVSGVNTNGDPTAAELIIRNNGSVTPLAPTLHLYDCPNSNCTEVKVLGAGGVGPDGVDDSQFGAWIIRERSDLANYPIELLDARVLLQLLTTSQLAALPGNWGTIMANHRTNLEEAKFRVDIDSMGDAQSEILTDRLIAEITEHMDGSDSDWLRRHFVNSQEGIKHGALTFLTEHKNLIEDMATTLFNKHSGEWSNYTFPFGRMPTWLIDAEGEHDAGEPHMLPEPWTKMGPSGTVHGTMPDFDLAGCWHDFPADASTPTAANGNQNLGQFICQSITNTDGFTDRPCTVAADSDNIGDYFVPGTNNGLSLHRTVEQGFHNGIHTTMGGAFVDASKTAGTAVFWAFHTGVSTNLYANWKHAQMRTMPAPDNGGTADSCVDNCGGNAGSCWCDDSCTNFGDCCDDFVAACQEPPVDPTLSCENNCGGNAGQCWCDDACTNLGDCCEDYAPMCGGSTASCDTNGASAQNGGFGIFNAPIQNNGTSPMNGWTATINFGSHTPTLVHFTDADSWEIQGNQLILTGNDVIQPGASITFGVNGNDTGPGIVALTCEAN